MQRLGDQDQKRVKKKQKGNTRVQQVCTNARGTYGEIKKKKKK